MFAKAKLFVIVLSALVVFYGLIGATMEKVSARDDAYKDLSIFTDVLNKVREDYVEEPNMSHAAKGVLHGMMEALDAYSSYLDPETYRKIEEEKKSRTASPGLILSKRYGYAFVVSVIPGSPADREGLRNGDLIESLDHKFTNQMSLLEAQSLLTGPAGTTVTMNVIRSRRTAPTEISLTRENLKLSDVTARIVEDGIGLLRIFHFNAGTSDAVLSKLKMLQASEIRGLLIDIRGSSEGELEEAVKSAGFFLPKATKILTVSTRGKEEKTYLAEAQPLVSGLPIVLLVDGGSSGPSEVFAAALQDHRVSEVVGERTNGQGSVQEFFTVGDGSVLFLTTQLFYRPNGSPLQPENLRTSGITPDVRSPSEDFITNFYYENSAEESERNLGEEFFRNLNRAIEQAQLNAGLERLREKALKKAA
ncbi:MAG: PDZ domain-containing protein [Acidobacteria bacterium]|nr:PDZ domain-containing protein [Acidobacteriota bacterium]